MVRRAVVRRAIRVMTGRVVWKKNRDLVSRDVSERSGRPCTGYKHSKVESGTKIRTRLVFFLSLHFLHLPLFPL